ncbi:hypothetical protein DPMN_130764 [Dreissena polymorpha]|uniref:Uncharacterized protein n=1 Tax=Dreissena polymorpha TaxID=45954 RepID=A0A9D4H3F8_DREPO|nr:hypothetical protein DPMN_130764 [Dreissena polymorpha]
MTLTEETTYLASMGSSKGELDPEVHWDMNDNILPLVSRYGNFHVIKGEKWLSALGVNRVISLEKM